MKSINLSTNLWRIFILLVVVSVLFVLCSEEEKDETTPNDPNTEQPDNNNLDGQTNDTNPDDETPTDSNNIVKTLNNIEFTFMSYKTNITNADLGIDGGSYGQLASNHAVEILLERKTKKYTYTFEREIWFSSDEKIVLGTLVADVTLGTYTFEAGLDISFYGNDR